MERELLKEAIKLVQELDHNLNVLNNRQNGELKCEKANGLRNAIQSVLNK